MLDRVTDPDSTLETTGLKRFFLHSCFVTGVLLTMLGVVPAGAQDLVLGFSVSPDNFSPDGDGKADSTGVSFRVREDSVVVSIFVFESDTATVVDTLLSNVLKNRQTRPDTLWWNGTDANGATVVDGPYVLRIEALKDTRSTTKDYRVWVDLIAPTLVFQQRVPSVLVPGVPTQPQTVQVVFDVFGSTAPGGLPAGDFLSGVVKTPAGSALTDSLKFIPPFAGDGRYTGTWKASYLTAAADTVYSISIDIMDNADHYNSFEVPIDVNVKGPLFEFLSLRSDQSLAVLPDSLFGRIYDRYGIDLGSTTVRYASASTPVPLHRATVRNRFVFFAVPLADSMVEEGEYTLFFDSADPYDKTSTAQFKIELDRTAPVAPVLDPFDGVWHGPEYRLTGSWSGQPGILRFYRGGIQIDSVASVANNINRNVPLVSGRNVFTATGVDAARNESAPSNAVVVTFDDVAGLYIRAPFRPGDEFQLNLSREASHAKLRLYDLAGDLVATVSRSRPAKNFVFRWDGRNGSGTDVKRGPLVAVAVAVFENGEEQIFREIFLFDPSP